MCAVLFVLALTLVALPGAATATVYCVDTTPAQLGDNNTIDPSCETAQGTIREGLQAAAANPGPDTVAVGPGEYSAPVAPNAIAYSNSVAGNLIRLVGIGQPHLTLAGTVGVQTAVNISAPAGSEVEGLHITIPANSDGNHDTGLAISAGSIATDMTIDGPQATNAVGVVPFGDAELRDSTVDLPLVVNPGNTAVAPSNGAATIDNSLLRADVGVQTSNVAGLAVTVEGSTIEAGLGTTTDGGGIVVRDSVIDLGPEANAIGIQLANNNPGSQPLIASVDGVTIVGGGTNSAGVRVQADDNLETANATIASTVLDGQTTPIQVWADNGRTAKATVTYSNLRGEGPVEVDSNHDGSGASGTAEYLPSAVTSLDPGFVDAAGGDFHLAVGSPLIDAGDPAAPPAGALDFDGQPRAVDAGACPLSAGRRDVGADEFLPVCLPQGPVPGGGSVGPVGAPVPPPSPPATAIKLKGKQRIRTTKKTARVVFKLSSDKPGSTFRCKLDGKGYRPCGATFAVALKPGRHTVRAVAVAGGLTDPTPALKRVTVVAAGGSR